MGATDYFFKGHKTYIPEKLIAISNLSIHHAKKISLDGT